MPAPINYLSTGVPRNKFNMTRSSVPFVVNEWPVSRLLYVCKRLEPVWLASWAVSYIYSKPSQLCTSIIITNTDLSTELQSLKSSNSGTHGRRTFKQCLGDFRSSVMGHKSFRTIDGRDRVTPEQGLDVLILWYLQTILFHSDRLCIP